MGGFSFSHSLLLAACLHGVTFIAANPADEIQIPPSRIALHIKLGANFGNEKHARAMDTKTWIKQENHLPQLEPASTIPSTLQQIRNKDKPSLISTPLKEKNNTAGSIQTPVEKLPSPPPQINQVSISQPTPLLKQASAMGSPLGDSMAEDAEYLDEYNKIVSHWISKYKQYPKEARRLGQEGQTVIQVDITPEGRINDYYIIESSGYPLLDQAALDAPRLAGSVPHVPENYPSEPVMGFEVPMIFTLED